jgi:WD40 repeat protein
MQPPRFRVSALVCLLMAAPPVLAGEMIPLASFSTPSAVHCLAFSGDGKTLAAAGKDQTVRLWDVTRERVRATLEGHRAQVCALAFSPDGTVLASGDDRGMVFLWDAATGRRQAVLKSKARAVFSLALAPDGRTLAAGCNRGRVRIWDLRKGKLRAVLKGHRGEVRHLAYTPDGKLLACGDWDQAVRLWDVLTKKIKAVFRREDDIVGAVAVAGRAGLLAVGGSLSGEVRIWNLRTRKPCNVLAGHKNSITFVAVTSDGTILASAGYDQMVKLWDLVAGRQLAEASANIGNINALALTRDGTALALGGKNGRIERWRLLAHQPGMVRLWHNGRVRSVAFSPDGKRVLTVDDTADKLYMPGIGLGGSLVDVPHKDKPSMARLWDVATGRLQATFPIPDSFAFSPDARTLALAEPPGRIRRFDMTAGRNLPPLIGHRGRVITLVFAPDGKTLASVSMKRDLDSIGSGPWPPSFKLWDLAAGKVVLSEELVTSTVALKFSSDCRTLVLCASDPQFVIKWYDVPKRKLRLKKTSDQSFDLVGIRADKIFAAGLFWDASGTPNFEGGVWSLSTGKEFLCPKPQRNKIAWLYRMGTSTADGQMVAGSIRDNIIQLWAGTTGKEQGLLKGHTHQPSLMTFSADGKLLASGSDTGTIRIWDVSAAKERLVLRGHSGKITALEFARSGNFLASGGTDKTARLWDLAALLGKKGKR